MPEAPLHCLRVRPKPGTTATVGDACGDCMPPGRLFCAAGRSVASILPPAVRTDLVPVRGHVQSVHLYGVTNARPVIVSSGDGGWIHLGPHVAELPRRTRLRRGPT